MGDPLQVPPLVHRQTHLPSWSPQRPQTRHPLCHQALNTVSHPHHPPPSHQAVAVSNSGLFTTLRELTLFEGDTHEHSRGCLKQAFGRLDQQQPTPREPLDRSLLQLFQRWREWALTGHHARHRQSLVADAPHLACPRKTRDHRICAVPALRLPYWHDPGVGTIQELMVVYRYYMEPSHVKDYGCCEYSRSF